MTEVSPEGWDLEHHVDPDPQQFLTQTVSSLGQTDWIRDLLLARIKASLA